MRHFSNKFFIVIVLGLFLIIAAGCNANTGQETKSTAATEPAVSKTSLDLAARHPASNSTVATSTEPLGEFSLDEIGASNIVDVNFVESKIGDPNWVIIDGREKKDYDKGHIPGAVNFPNSIVKTLKDPMDGRVIPGDRMAKLLGEIGVSNDKKVIIYGKAGDYHVLCEMGPLYFGLSEWDYLDSGYEGWVKAGKKVETTPVKPTPATFTAKVVNPNMYVSTYQMAQIVESKDPKYYIIDVRSEEEFNGQGIQGVRAGRIPGAHSYPVNKNLDKDTKALLPLDKLAELYKDVPKDKTVILYCHRGCRTGFAFLALRALGYKDVRVYEDGFVVWNQWLELPVEEEHFLNFRGDIKTTVEQVKEMTKDQAGH
ncbi:sulfurtransferase [Thermincola potens]|uniref:thiosulfate sulfurtransferase n=1 Tax=Thermincola potens (strain JR) TaxID=635013 RepID=D5XB14_THEPJ|nr:rhodanese-like domain-containing protein [Thermincola potens]ADG81334.1 Rhodanese domain protein [Thermincola potens JR]